MATARLTQIIVMDVEVPEGMDFSIQSNLEELFEDNSDDRGELLRRDRNTVIVEPTYKDGDMPFGLTNAEMKFMATMLRRGITRADLIALSMTELEAATFVAEGLVKKAPVNAFAAPGTQTPYVLTERGKAFANLLPVEWWKRPEKTTVRMQPKEPKND